MARKASARWSARTARVEELYLAGALMRGLGSENIDYRLRNAEFASVRGRALARHLDRVAVATCSARW